MLCVVRMKARPCRPNPSTLSFSEPGSSDSARRWRCRRAAARSRRRPARRRRRGETSFGNTGIVQSEAILSLHLSAPSRRDRQRRAQSRSARAYPLCGAAGARRRRSGAIFAPRRRSAGAQRPRGLRALVARRRRRASRVSPPRPGPAALLARAAAGSRFSAPRAARARVRRRPRSARGFGVNYACSTGRRSLALEPHLGEAAIGGVHFTDPLTTPDPGGARRRLSRPVRRARRRMAKGDARSLDESPGGWTGA